MNRDAVRQTATITTFVLTIVVNALANILPINGRNTGQISDSFANFFVPAGYVFGIWSIIYLGLLAFVVYQALPAQRENKLLREIGPWFIGSNLLNAVWILAWHYSLVPLSLLIMLGLLGCLLVIYTILDRNRSEARGAWRWLVNPTFSLYLGWITVATIINVSVTLISVGWDGFGISGEVWAVALLVIGTIIGALVALPRRDWLYAVVLVWAFFGIGVKFAALPLLANAAYIAAAVAAVIVLLNLFRNLNSGCGVRRTAQA